MPTFEHRNTVTTRTFKAIGAPMHTPYGWDFQIDPTEIKVEFRNGSWASMTIRGFRVTPDYPDGAGGATDEIWHRENLPEWLLPLTDINYEG